MSRHRSDELDYSTARAEATMHMPVRPPASTKQSVRPLWGNVPAGAELAALQHRDPRIDPPAGLAWVAGVASWLFCVLGAAFAMALVVGIPFPLMVPLVSASVSLAVMLAAVGVAALVIALSRSIRTDLKTHLARHRKGGVK